MGCAWHTFAKGQASSSDGAVAPQGRSEEPLTELGEMRYVWSWSHDSEGLLLSQRNSESQKAEIWLIPATTHPQAKVASRRIISNPDYNLFQAFFSPDGQWIVFEAVKIPPAPNLESDLYVMPAAGGPWTLISKGKPWEDKPRWSPEGIRSTSFPAVEAFSTCGESALIQPREGHVENPSV
jgi:Tol biopolymer transport system component